MSSRIETAGDREAFARADAAASPAPGFPTEEFVAMALAGMAQAHAAAPSSPSGPAHPLAGRLLGGHGGPMRIRFPSRPDLGTPPCRALAGAGALRDGQEVLAIFEGGDGSRPVVLGAFGETGRMRIEAEEEIVLACGKSTLSLDADGRITLRGVDILSRASRANKVKGGVVHLN